MPSTYPSEGKHPSPYVPTNKSLLTPENRFRGECNKSDRTVRGGHVKDDGTLVRNGQGAAGKESVADSRARSQNIFCCRSASEP